MIECEQNRKEELMRKCPFLNRKCIEHECMVWIRAETDCAIPQIVYSLNLIKEDHLRVISRKFKQEE